MNREGEKTGKGLKETYIPRMMPIGGIIILLALLLPLLMGKKHEDGGLAKVEPPLAMKMYATGYASIDSLLNEGLRHFGRREYEDAARMLAEAHFFWSVKIREGSQEPYPEDLRFYLGLSEFYRGYPAKGAPYLEEEERAHPYEARYPWFLAHCYIAQGRFEGARTELEKVVRLGGSWSAEAREKLRRLPAPSPIGRDTV